MLFFLAATGAGPGQAENRRDTPSGNRRNDPEELLIEDDGDTQPSDQTDAAVVDLDSDEDMMDPIWTSTPQPSQGAPQQLAETFVTSLYDCVINSGARIKEGHSLAAKAIEVGAIEEELDHLICAEANPRGGPAYDLQVLRKLMSVFDVPQVVPFMCFDAREVRKQCHADSTPLVLFRYRPTKNAMAMLSSLLTTDILDLLRGCNLHAALQGSDFDDKVCENNQKSTTSNLGDMEIRILYPTLSPNKMVVGSIVSGTDREFLKEFEKALRAAHEACQTLKAHWNLIQQDRALKEQQERDLRASEAADKVKAVDLRTEGEEDMNETVVDTEEVRKRRLEALEEKQTQKRSRDSDGSDIDDSGTIEFNQQC